MASGFTYNPIYQLLICKKCEYALKPSIDAQRAHLRKEPHGLQGKRLSTLLAVLESYGHLRGPDTVAHPNVVVPAVAHIAIHQVYDCRLCVGALPTRNLRLLKTHISNIHHTPPKHQTEEDHYRKYPAQTFFSQTVHLNYFEVLPSDTPAASDPDALPPSTPYVEFFKELRDNRKQEDEARARTLTTIAGFAAHKSEVIPWLRTLGIHEHLRGLPLERVVVAARSPIKPACEASTSRNLFVTQTNLLLQKVYSHIGPGKHCLMSHQTLGLITQYDPTETGKVDVARHQFSNILQQHTLEKYFRVWTQFVLYYLDIHSIDLPEEQDSHRYWWPELETRPEGTDIPQDSLLYPDKEQMPVAQLLELSDAIDSHTESGFPLNDEQITELAEPLLMEFFAAMLMSHGGPNPFTIALMSFASLHAVKRSTNTFQDAGDFTPALSGLIWVAQVLLFEHSVRLCQQKTGSTDNVVKYTHQVFNRAGRHHHQTPLGYLLNWRDLLKAVSKDTTRSKQAIWNQEGTRVSYNGTDLRMEEVTQLLVHQYDQASRLLYDELLFGAQTTTRLRANQFTDNPREQTDGVSLFDLNKSWLPPDHLENIILRSRTLVGGYVHCSPGMSDWKEDAVNHYEATVQEFLAHLLVLVHIGSGQPLRQPELLSIKWKNTQNQMRSIFVHDSHVMLRVTYHKGLYVTGRTKDNMRFLPPSIGNLLLDFLAYVQPLRREFLRQTCPSQMNFPFLWSHKGKVWGDDKVTQSLRSGCRAAGVPEIGVSTWRQMTVAIVKAHFRPHLANFDVDPGDEVLDEDEEDFRAMTMQRNHTIHTSNISYANQHSYGGMGDEAVQRNRRASELWARFFHIEVTIRSSSKRSLEQIDDSHEEDPLSKRISAGRVRKKKHYTSKELLAAARALYADDDFKWRCSQKRVLEAMMIGRELVIAIMPTGSGKSLLFMLPASLPSAGVTLLVLPLVSLRTDMVRRLRELQISHTVWSPGTQPQASVVMVSVEAAIGNDFRSYALGLIAAQRLDRIVIDECHLTVTATSYRKSMTQLPTLRSLDANILYLTATLPPSMLAEFSETNHLEDPVVIRASSDRPNISYNVQRVRMANKTLLEAAACTVLDHHIKDSRSMPYVPQDKIIVYCKSIDAVKEVAGLLSCPYYTSDSGDVEQRHAILSRWLDDSDMPYIVATSALSAGFDYAHIRKVWHVDEPRSIVDFAQEAGRAGRDGSPASSTVLLDRGWKPQHTSNTGTGETDRAAVHRYLASHTCLRRELSMYLDEPEMYAETCLLGTPTACSLCRSRKEPEPNSHAGHTRPSFPSSPRGSWGPFEPLSSATAQDAPPPLQSPPVHNPNPTPPSAQPLHLTSSVTSTISRPGQTIILTSNPTPSSPEFSSPAITSTPTPAERHRAASSYDTPEYASAAGDAMPPPPRSSAIHTGRKIILSKAQQNQTLLNRFRKDLLALRNTCTLCRAQNRDFEHTFNECTFKQSFLNYKTRHVHATGRNGWFQNYTACFFCYLPQSVCSQPATNTQSPGSSTLSKKDACQFRDLMLPWLYGKWETSAEEFMYEHEEEVNDQTQFFTWVAIPEPFAGEKATRGAVFMADHLRAHKLY